MKAGDRILDLSSPVVMAILNVTPDSFFEGSRRQSDGHIGAAVEKAAREGAGIIDVGGYSSRPGAADVSPREEYERLAKGVASVRRLCPGMMVSIDTFRASVAERIIGEYGSCIINDISAGELDPEMIPTAARLGVPYIAMHMRANPATMQQHTEYRDVTDEVKAFFREKIARLREAGISDIIIDPGFGFAKTTEQNYQLMSRMDELSEFGLPILSGISRKSMIYKVLGTTPAEALAGTTALNWESLAKGASILRVHDTREAVEVVRLYNFYIDNQCKPVKR